MSRDSTCVAMSALAGRAESPVARFARMQHSEAHRASDYSAGLCVKHRDGLWLLTYASCCASAQNRLGDATEPFPMIEAAFMGESNVRSSQTESQLFLVLSGYGGSMPEAAATRTGKQVGGEGALPSLKPASLPIVNEVLRMCLREQQEKWREGEDGQFNSRENEVQRGKEQKND